MISLLSLCPAGQEETSLLWSPGSDWGVAARSTKQELAVKWIDIATSDDIQLNWVFAHDGWLPNSVQGLDRAMRMDNSPEKERGFFEAAKNSKSTPGSPNWYKIEGDKSINMFTQSIATGANSISEATQRFDRHLDETLADGPGYEPAASTSTSELQWDIDFTASRMDERAEHCMT